MPDQKTYVGTCHCGKVKFEATLVLESAMDCNCSIDSRTAAVMAALPAEQFKLVSGEGEMTEYLFGKRHIHRCFCKTCGIHAFAYGAGRDGKPMKMINLRCVESVDLSKLKITHNDGKSR
jgi:hypothetical protein